MHPCLSPSPLTPSPLTPSQPPLPCPPRSAPRRTSSLMGMSAGTSGRFVASSAVSHSSLRASSQPL